MSMQKKFINVCEMIYINSDWVLSHKDIVKAQTIRGVNEAVPRSDNQSIFNKPSYKFSRRYHAARK
jgi:hypothetical protein